MTLTRRTALLTLLGLAASGCNGINRPTLFNRNRCDPTVGPDLGMPVGAGPMTSGPVIQDGTYPAAPTYQPPVTAVPPGQYPPPPNPAAQPPTGPMPRPSPQPPGTTEPYRPIKGNR